jgi:hypothetical protein
MNGDTDRQVLWTWHPYAVYDPKYGWGIALRQVEDSTEFIGRALVNTKDKVFVRSYCNSSHDPVLEQWLKAHGYEHKCGWPEGLLLKHYHHPQRDALLLPYIDGDNRRVSEMGDGTLMIDEDGEYIGENTNGAATQEGHSDDEYLGDCDCCGESVYESDDERIWAGRDEDILIGSCCSDNYTYVRGTSWTGRPLDYYIHEDNVRSVVTSSGYRLFHIDVNNVPDGVVFISCDEEYTTDEHATYCERTDDYIWCEDAVELANGDWDHKELCWKDGNGDWHHEDEEAIVYEGDLYLKEDAWQCAGTLLWYPEHIENWEGDDGKLYHPNYVSRVNSDAEDESIVELRINLDYYITTMPVVRTLVEVSYEPCTP